MISTDSYYPAVLAIATLDGNIIHRGSGVLLAGGKYILTAAHLVAGDSTAADISLGGPGSLGLPGIKNIVVHPDWDPGTYNNDIAIIELEQPITAIEGLDLYRGDALLGQQFVRVGYGDGPDASQHIGTNVYDAPGEVLNDPYARQIPDGSQLLYDFDNGSDQQNMLANFTGYHSDSTPSDQEVLARAGDSGGPALINGQVAGIASYVVADPSYDVDSDVASSPGEVGADTSIVNYLSWIDGVTGSATPAEMPPAEVVANEWEAEVCIDAVLLCPQAPEDITVWPMQEANSETDASQAGWWGMSDAAGFLLAPDCSFAIFQSQSSDSTMMPFINSPAQPWLDESIVLLGGSVTFDSSLVG